MKLRVLILVALSGFAASSAPGAPGDPAWSLDLSPSKRQIVVKLDTRPLPSNMIIEEATFTAQFLGSGNTKVGARNYSLIDARLPVIEPGHVYLRRLAQPFNGVIGIVATNLTIVRAVEGGKADGPEIDRREMNLGGPSAMGGALPDRDVDGGNPIVTHLNLLATGQSVPLERCRSYAKNAIEQNATNLRGGCAFNGSRWSADYPGHYRWCLAQDADLVAAETRARSQGLRQCTIARMHAHVLGKQ